MPKPTPLTERERLLLYAIRVSRPATRRWAFAYELAMKPCEHGRAGLCSTCLLKNVGA